tara:strand:+ start:1112 stop:1414 length:303 start_codon:yes stop_codon:yes gene_type:complete
MAITYTWTIPSVERTIASGGIDTIHWRCNAVDGDYSVGSYGTVGCSPDPDASDFIAYADVTEANCIAWVQADVSKDDTESGLAAQIAELKTPITGSGTPW